MPTTDMETRIEEKNMPNTLAEGNRLNKQTAHARPLDERECERARRRVRAWFRAELDTALQGIRPPSPKPQPPVATGWGRHPIETRFPAHAARTGKYSKKYFARAAESGYTQPDTIEKLL